MNTYNLELWKRSKRRGSRGKS